MNAKKILVLGLVMVLAFAFTFIVMGYRKAEQLKLWSDNTPASQIPAPMISQATHQRDTPAAKIAPGIPVSPPVIPKTATSVTANTPVAPDQTIATPGGKAPIQDPEARAALSFVGADPDAEEYWVAAINDPTLGANERKDLIEDLNEDGLSDPKHPGAQDVPLIVSRLQLIEELAPYAMDKVNADAFEEAHKDLVDMLDGKPVQ